jgi:hypothetical protein
LIGLAAFLRTCRHSPDGDGERHDQAAWSVIQRATLSGDVMVRHHVYGGSKYGLADRPLAVQDGSRVVPEFQRLAFNSSPAGIVQGGFGGKAAV